MNSKEWCTNHEEVLAFARVLAESYVFHTIGQRDAIQNVIYYFEKPYKWTEEYEAWTKAGKPETIEV